MEFEEKMIWDECFVGRNLKEDEIVVAASQLFGIQRNQVRVVTPDAWEAFMISPFEIEAPVVCRLSELNGIFPLQVHFYISEKSIEDEMVNLPESFDGALRQLAKIWDCQVITSHETDPGDLFYLVDEHGKTLISVNLDWLEEHNEVIYKIATDEMQSDE